MVTLLLLFALAQPPEPAEAVAPGVTYRRVERAAGGPFVFHVLEVDPASPAVNILPVRALDRAAGKETTSAMAARHGAVAAVNGGYFAVAGPLAGTSAGVYLSHGEILASGVKRSALLFCREKDQRERTAIEVVNFRGRLKAKGGATRAIDGLNRPRAANEVVLYTPALGPSTPTGAGGTEAVLDAQGVVREVGGANTPIPRDGAVLSASGEAAEWLREHLKPGAKVKVEKRLESAALAACRPGNIVGAGPRLIKDGKAALSEEGFAHRKVRHPRTAFAVTRRGTFLFVTLDGRQKASVGMTLEELAEELLRWDALEAINLDGGGSSTLVAAGRIRNQVSDPRERAVSDAILIFSISSLAEWRTVFEKLAQGQIQAGVAERIRERVARAARGDLQSALRLIRRERGKGLTAPAAEVLAEPLAAMLSARRW